MYLSNFLLYDMIQKMIFSEYSHDRIWVYVFFCILLLVLSCYVVSAVIYKLSIPHILIPRIAARI